MLFGVPWPAIVGITVGGFSILVYLGRGAYLLYRGVRRIEVSMNYVEHEMRHNGGDTLRSEMHEAQEHLLATDARLDQTHERLCSINRRLDSLGATRAPHRGEPVDG